LDICDYVNRRTPNYEFPNKALVVRSQGQHNLLNISRYFPFSQFSSNILSNVGRHFIIAPVSLNSPLSTFKPKKAEWTGIWELRDKNKNGKSFEFGKYCYCKKKKASETPTLDCKCCYKRFHRACLIEKRKCLNPFYCDECTELYIVEVRPAITKYNQLVEIARKDGEEMRRAKKEQLTNGKTVKKTERRHDQKAGELQTRTGIKRRELTDNEKAAINDLDGNEVDLGLGIASSNDFLESEDDELDDFQSQQEIEENAIEEEDI
jgi:hypothetical protein